MWEVKEAFLTSVAPILLFIIPTPLTLLIQNLQPKFKPAEYIIIYQLSILSGLTLICTGGKRQVVDTQN